MKYSIEFKKEVKEVVPQSVDLTAGLFSFEKTVPSIKKGVSLSFNSEDGRPAVYVVSSTNEVRLQNMFKALISENTGFLNIEKEGVKSIQFMDVEEETAKYVLYKKKFPKLRLSVEDESFYSSVTKSYFRSLLESFKNIYNSVIVLYNPFGYQRRDSMVEFMYSNIKDSTNIFILLDLGSTDLREMRSAVSSQNVKFFEYGI